MICYDQTLWHKIRVHPCPPWPTSIRGPKIVFLPQMPSTPRNIKPRVILFSALAVVCAAVAAGLWYWRANKASIIRNSIEKAVDKKSAGLYKVDYADLHLDELA